MSTKRAFWVLASPFAWALHRVGWCSFTHVNVCHGARHPDRFDALWQHRWYGEPIPTLPAEVGLCGIPYETAVAEGTVTFVDPCTMSRITFDRDPYDRFADQWTVLLAGSTSIPAAHVRQAYEWVCAVFGDSFETRSIPTTASIV
ncbi:MAG TPA: hypothetical protein VN600_06890 [Gemmatimonadaceae bacterium]|nr:hypothetical protein [Gemmatimonadaceae bacterium]